MRTTFAGLISAGLLAVSCTPLPLKVPVEAGPADLAALAGEWSGTYETREGPRRSGDIAFKLQAGTDTAVGFVIMSSRPEPARIEPGVYPAPPVSELLAISFVRAVGGRISGELAPYTDPYCGCRLRTVFVGRLRADLIEGTYTSYHLDGGSVATGEWRATRGHK